MAEALIKSTIESLVPNKDKIALDIGAHHGAYTNLLAEKFGHVYAFEIDQKNLDALTKNIKHDNITIVPKAISTKDGNGFFYQSKRNPGGHTISHLVAENGSWGHDKNQRTPIKMITLDTFCKTKNIGFIKCDIEGGENFIFEFGKETLQNNKMTIALETHATVDVDLLYRFFISMGYAVNGPDGEVSAMEINKHYIISNIKE